MKLKIKRNVEVGGKLLTVERTGGKKIDMKDGLKFTVLSPFAHRVEDSRSEWDKVVTKLKKTKGAEAQAIAAEFLDESVFNLSSIVVMAVSGGKRMLLTGDRSGDDVIAGLKAAKLLKNGQCRVDLLKLPHHGSDRNVASSFFKSVTADHYVISADGKHGNPDPPTLKMLTEARGSDEYMFHLTNLPDPPHKAKKFLEKDQEDNARKDKVVVRKGAGLSLRVELGDPLAD